VLVSGVANKIVTYTKQMSKVAIIGGLLLMICCSSLSSVAMTMGEGDDTPKKTSSGGSGVVGPTATAKETKETKEADVVKAVDPSSASTKTITPAPIVLSDGVYAIKGGMANKWCADESHLGRILCNRNDNQISTWEKFDLKHLGDNIYSIKGNGKKGKYCSDGGPDGTVVCNLDTVGEYEKFFIKTLGAGKYAMRGGQGKWCADESHRNRIICSREDDEISTWEKWEFNKLS